MPNWWIKAGIQRAIRGCPIVPGGMPLFQQYVTRSIVLSPGQCADKLRETHRYFQSSSDNMREDPPELQGLEIGTGWYPTIPLAFICGARSSQLRHRPATQRERLKALLKLLVTFDADGTLAIHLQAAPGPAQTSAGAVQLDHEVTRAWLNNFNIHVAVRDARNTG
ncbi:MAG: hypothetical protein U1F83_20375 [Verrucomicrobiota bacterium]